MLLFLLNVKFSHFFIFWFFKYLPVIGRHLYVGRCLRWQMIHMNRDRHKKKYWNIMVIYKILRGVKLFELCCIYTCMLHILQWLSWSKNTSPTLITSSLLHPLIFTLQIFLIYPRIWFVHSLLLILPPPLSFQQFTKWLGLIILNHGMNKLPWRGLFIKTVV